jgi:hypothetical protein
VAVPRQSSRLAQKVLQRTLTVAMTQNVLMKKLGLSTG